MSFAGLCFGASWHAARKITRPGLEQLPGNIGETALSESGGHPGGQFGSDSETVASLRLRAIADLNQALASVKAWHDVVNFTEGDLQLKESLPVLMRLKHLLQQQQQDY